MAVSFAKPPRFRKADKFKGVDDVRLKSFSVLFFLILYSACASYVTNIRIEKDELSDLKNAEKAVVITKNGSSHKIKHVTVDSEKIYGVEQSFLHKAKPIALQTDEIEDIFIKGVRDDDGRIITETEISRNRISGSRFLLPVVAGVGSIVPALFLSFLASSSDFSDEQITETQGAIFTLTFYSTVFFITYSGYKLGKSLDDRLALKRIEEKRKHAGIPKGR